MAKIGEI